SRVCLTRATRASGPAMLTPASPRLAVIAAAALLAVAPAARAQRNNDVDTAYAREHYTKSEYMVPMRDGVKLYTIVYAPKDTSLVVPIMLLRTPYGIGPHP